MRDPGRMPPLLYYFILILAAILFVAFVIVRNAYGPPADI
jgi:hypothetical protein